MSCLSKSRRHFLTNAAVVSAGAWLSPRTLAGRLALLPVVAEKFAASDTVTIGQTGIKTSRLAMGTGTVGSGHHSHQMTQRRIDARKKRIMPKRLPDQIKAHSLYQ